MTKIKIIQEIIALMIRATIIPLVIREVFQRNKVTILLYHKISLQLFEKHLQYLSKRYSIISFDEFIKARNQNNMKKLPTKSVVITFDDGAKNNLVLGEALQKYSVPITMFVCSDIIGTNRHFWFSYLDRVKENLKKVEDNERLKLLFQVGFDEKKNYETAEALSESDIAKLLALGMRVQSHTLTHPILPMCEDTKAEVEITKSKIDLENKLGIKVDYFSYPNGDYLPRDIDICKRAGYLAATTMDAGFNDMRTDLFRLKRISICDNASVNQLIVKTTGVWSVVKKLFRL